MKVKEILDVMDDCYILLTEAGEYGFYSPFSCEEMEIEENELDEPLFIVDNFENFYDRIIEFVCPYYCSSSGILVVVMKGKE